MAKIGIGNADTMTLLALRYACVLALLLPVCLIVRPAWPDSINGWGHLALVGFLIQVVYFGAAWTAMERGVSAGTVAVITCLYPILVALVMPAISKEVVDARRWSGLVLGLGGSVIVIVSSTGLRVDSITGLAFATAALIAFTLATVWEKRYGIVRHPLVTNVVQYAVGFGCTLPLAMMFEPMNIEWTLPFTLALMYLVVCNSILAISLLLFLIRQGEATRVSALFFLVPPLSALIAWWLLDEELAPLAWLGMFIAATGVYLVTARSPKAGTSG